MSETKKRTVSVAVIGEEAEAAEETKVEEIELDEEEQKNAIRMNEEELIQGLIDAADFQVNDVKKIEIYRDKKLAFEFHIRPLTSEEYNRCKKKWTKYVRNKQFGMKLPEETNTVKYQSAIIYTATTKEDTEKLWDNKRVWQALRDKGLQIMNGLDVIEFTLKAGEKDKILEAIDSISGFDSNLEEVAKN